MDKKIGELGAEREGDTVVDQSAMSDPSFDGERDLVEVCRDVGRGRCIILLRDAGATHNVSEWLYAALIEKFSRSMRLIEFLVNLPLRGADWERASRTIESDLLAKGIRYCHVIGSSDSSVVSQHLAITKPKLCQSLVLVNPVFRASPTFMTKVASRLEEVLPLGLPLRMGGDQFVSASFLHRIRCPSLVVVSSGIPQAAANDMVKMAHRIPTAWFWELSGLCAEEEFSELMRKFLLVKHRCPMRR